MRRLLPRQRDLRGDPLAQLGSRQAGSSLLSPLLSRERNRRPRLGRRDRALQLLQPGDLVDQLGRVSIIGTAQAADRPGDYWHAA